jgi:ketosteroid isomerase-like protein
VSQEQVEIAEKAMDAFNTRDLDAFTHSMTSDIEWLPALERGLDGRGYVGHEGVAAYFANLEATWDELRFRADEYRDLGDQVLALGHIGGRGTRGGVPVDAPMGIVFDFRGLEISRARSFLDHGEALNAAGLKDG